MNINLPQSPFFRVPSYNDDVVIISILRLYRIRIAGRRFVWAIPLQAAD